MSDPSPNQFLTDPLSDIIRKERRNLLITSAIGFLVSFVGLVPTKIVHFGIELSNLEQKSFLCILGAISIYFWCAFLVYGLSDFLIWRLRYQDFLTAVHRRNEGWTYEDQVNYDEMHQNIPRIHWLYSFSNPLCWARIGFDFLVPILMGGLSIAVVIAKIISF